MGQEVSRQVNEQAGAQQGRDAAFARLKDWYVGDLQPGQTTPLSLLMIQGTRFCNIDCKYCYLPLRTRKGKFDLDLIDPLFGKLDDAGLIGDELTVLWHAGEPLVLPVDYYRQAFARVAAVAPAHTTINHHFQTNATLISDDYCELIKEFDIAVGVSIDDPAHLHDANRVNRTGKGTHADTMAGVQKLRDHDIRYSAICVTGSVALDQPDEMYEFFRDFGAYHVGFNVEELEGNHTTTSLATADAKRAMRLFMRRMLERSQTDRWPFQVREARIVANGRYQAPAWKLQQEAADLAIISVDLEGRVFTYSPELLDLKDAAGNDYSIGRVDTIDFTSVQQSPALAKMRTEIDAGIEMCRASCRYFDLCGGGTPVNKLSENGSFASGETVHCQLRRQVLIDLGRELTPPAARSRVAAASAVASTPDHGTFMASIPGKAVGRLQIGKPVFGAPIRDAIGSGIVVHPDLVSAGRVMLSAGTAPAPADAPTILYASQAIVPRGPWALPTTAQAAALSAIRAGTGNFAFVSVVKIPDDIWAELQPLGQRLAPGDQLTKPPQAITDALIARFGDPKAQNNVLGMFAAPGFDLTATVDRKLGKRIGLHVDSWSRSGIGQRKSAGNRLCVNVGDKPRALLFINLPVAEIYARLKLTHEPQASEMGRAFMRQFPNYPVARIEVRPGEAYIAPTENIIHDGCATEGGLDATLTIIGEFRDPSIALSSPRGHRVRRATASDIEQAVALYGEHHPQSAHAAIAFDPQRLKAHLQLALDDESRSMFVYETAGGRGLEGFITGKVEPFVFSEQLSAREAIILVDPAHRGGLVAHRLWRTFARWARSRGAAHIDPGLDRRWRQMTRRQRSE